MGNDLFRANYLDLSKVSKITHDLRLPKVSKMTHNIDLPTVSKMVHNLNLVKVRKMSSLRQSALKSIYLRSAHSAVRKTSNYIKNVFAHSIKNHQKTYHKPIIKRFKPIIRRTKRNCKTTCEKKRY